MEGTRCLGERTVTTHFEPGRNAVMSLAAAFTRLCDEKHRAAVTDASVQVSQREQRVAKEVAP